MERRALGNSGVDLPVIGFGCGPNARLMLDDDVERRLETVRAAIDSGITYFDTAYAYGWGTSETNLGRVLKQVDARVAISTKFCLQPEDLGDPRSAVLRGFEESLERLGLEAVDILVAHNRIAHSHTDGELNHVGALLNLREVFGKNGVAAALGELIDAKLIKTTGLTSFGGDPRAVAEALASGVFGSMNASFSLVNPSAGTAAPEGFGRPDYRQVISTAASFGVGVMAIQVLGRGVLAARDRSDEQVRRLSTFADAHDESLVSTAIRYVLCKSGVTTAILGLSQPSHVADAVAAVARGPYSASEIVALETLAFGPM